MFGVLSAFYLNECSTNRRQIEFRREAFSKLEAEIGQNKDYLESTYHAIDSFITPFSLIIEKYDDEEEGLRMTVAEMAGLRNNYPDFIVVTDSVPAGDSLFLYSGELDLQIPAIISMQLSEYAWRASLTGDIYSEVSFDCLYYFEMLYTIQRKVLTEFEDFFENLSNGIEDGEEEEFIRNAKLLLDYQKMLLDFYGKAPEVISNCKSEPI